MTNHYLKEIKNKIEIRSSLIGENLISVRNIDEFAILERRPNAEGLTCITFSTPLTAHDADLIDRSGIVEVIKFSKSGTLVFTRKSFYENNKMIELIFDILNRHEKTE